VIGGISSVEPTYCWLQLAAEASLDELVEIGDALTRRQRPVTTLARLEATVRDAGRRPGIARARKALSLIVPGTDSIPETDLRLLIVRAGLPVPTVDWLIRDETGRVVYRFELAYGPLKIAIEYDGAVHVGNRVRMEWDATRRRHLEDNGWRIITVTAADMVRDPIGIIASVRHALNRAV
jgi:hypothetical protein